MKNLRPLLFLFLAVLTFEQSQALDEIFDKNILKKYPVYEYDEGLVVLPKDGRAPFLKAIQQAKKSVPTGIFQT